MATIPFRLALASLALTLLVPACSTPSGASPTVPASLATAAASGMEAFCALDLQTNADVRAAVDTATAVTTGSDVDDPTVRSQVDTAVGALEGVNATGDAATARDAFVDALDAFGDDPSQASAAAVVAAHGAAVTAQDAACGS